MFRSRRFLVGCLMTAVSVSAQAQTTREVSYDARTIVKIQAKLRFTTMIILPEHEEILDVVCGDKDFWIVSGGQNLAYVKPAKAGATTNLNLVTASGTVYSFLLTEGAGSPDLKLYVTPDPSRAADFAPKFISAAQVDHLRREAQEARAEAEAAKLSAVKAADAAVIELRASYPARMQFPYRFKAHEKPFNVSAIYHDGQFTYIRADTTELPSLYEMRDNTPNLVNFQVEDGVYVVPKVLDRGYLAIGKERFAFVAEPGNGR